MKAKFNIPAALIALFMLSGTSTVFSVVAIFVQWILTLGSQSPPAWLLQWFGVSATIQLVLFTTFVAVFLVEYAKEVRK